ncbi:uncharacterized protein T069G_10278 [Trichoderma breve]|uniref:DUF7730 domain-containing protein n=1 Tax=Trichoderma breve TaxID=2034170 RepID=A0A9W9E2S2_9HYPO|nr:uncharacterized protein T069G_10278 [Trichoderma breve]KAJ4854720.1 hypothetical protein T069G_10278 [Trichoderma breve]
MASSISSSNSSAFLAIPLEIRRQIYRYCIPQKPLIDVSSGVCRKNRFDWSEELNEHPHHDPEEIGDTPFIEIEEDEESESETSIDCGSSNRIMYELYPSSRSSFPGLLLCCRQITEEVTDILYDDATMLIGLHSIGQTKLAKLPKAREKIRKMILILRPTRTFYNPDFRMDPNIWDSILGNLSILGIIAEQPPIIESPEEELENDLENDLEEWITWITPICDYIGRSLSREAEVVVDANDEEETVNVLEKAIPGRCRFQNFSMADVIFRRGRYSLESVYSGTDWDDFDDGPTSCRDIIADCDYDLYYSD